MPVGMPEATPAGGTETATFASGCFWCTEAVFSDLEGVVRVLPGYTGGTTKDPTYEAVCSDTTGHAEATEIVFDPRKISYHDLVAIFFTTHDPTTPNRQGHDVGSQYRSAIFYHSPEQRATAEAVKQEVETARLYRRPVVTEIVPAATFYPAEEYHRSYFRLHPERAYCAAVIAPKVAKFRTQYASRLKPGV
jgi:peptide-methionine (S)-S-oxide reductase